MSVSSPSELLPARMVNEHTYCPRLFWYMHVEGVFVDNAHTITGAAQHARVDKPGGRVDAPTEGEPDWESRALWLSSHSLGVTGRLDVVEVHEGIAMPVDRKKGRPTPEGGLWPSDEVQLALQGLLLRDSGYTVREIAAFYATPRRRVVVPLTQEVSDRARRAVQDAKATAAGGTIPAPLTESRKCIGCSLNSVCLPDETNALRAGRLAEQAAETIAAACENEAEANTETPVRRVVPMAVDALPLYVQEAGARVGVRGSSLVITRRKDLGGEKRSVGLHQIGQLCVWGSVQVSTQAVQACLRAGVPIYWFSGSGWFYGRAHGNQNRQIQARIAQFSAAGSQTAHAMACRLIADKLSNSRTLLRRNGASDAPELARLKRLSQRALTTQSPATLLGLEGDGAKRYWAAFSALLAESAPEFAMAGRTRRPPRDRTNAMLGLVYALLVKECTHAVEAAGLDPYLGVLHVAHHGAPALALDLMEPFRSLLGDSVVLGVVRRGELQPNDFVIAGEEVRLKTAGRRRLIEAFERRLQETIKHPVFGYTITYRQVLAVQARLMARTFSGEIPALPAFRTR